MIGKARCQMTAIELYNIVPQENILRYYITLPNIPCLINSPFRDDKNASLKVDYTNKDHIYFHDYGTGEHFYLMEFFRRLWNFNNNKDVIGKIYNDIILKQNVSHKLLAPTICRPVSKSSEIEIDVKIRSWKDHDLEYWNLFGISKEWLKFGDVYPISAILFSKDGFTQYIPAEKYAYVYVEFKDDKVSYKIYQPFSEKYKWTSTHDGSVWDLWSKLPDKGTELIITKSRKDALTIWENTDIPACSLQSEIGQPKIQVVNQLKERFDTVYVLYDNDFDKKRNIGRERGAAIAQEFGLKQIEIPTELRSKDASDLCKNYGRLTLRNTIFQLINN